MSTNVNYLLQELKNIKTAENNVKILSNNLRVYEDEKQKKDHKISYEALKAASAVYDEKKKKILKTPFPSITVASTAEEPSSYPDDTKVFCCSRSVASLNSIKSVVIMYSLNLLGRCGTIAALAMLCLGIILSVINGFLGYITFIMNLSGAILNTSYWCAVVFGALWFFSSRGGLESVGEVKEFVEKYDEYEKKRIEWDEGTKKFVYGLDIDNCKAEVEKLFETSKQYHKEFLVLVDEYDRVSGSIINEYEQALQKNEEEFKIKQSETNAKLESCRNYLDSVTLIHPSMFCKIDKLYRALELGRADSIKDAINIVLDDERCAQEAEERRQEAERQQAVLERQASEARAHQIAMEKQAEAEARKKESELKDRKAAAHKRCYYCANAGSCSTSVMNSFTSTGDVCPSYRPKQ